MHTFVSSTKQQMTRPLPGSIFKDTNESMTVVQNKKCTLVTMVGNKIDTQKWIRTNFGLHF